MSGGPYVDEVAPWPGRAGPVTAEALARYHLARGLAAGHVVWEHGGEVSPLRHEQVAGALSHDLERVAWTDYLRLVETVGDVTEVCYLLGRLREVDQAVADDAAAWLVGMAEAGEQLSWLHETAQRSGLDTERVRSEADAAWQGRMSTPELATAVADLARDLVQMGAETAIVLASWPAACRLVDLAGAWPGEDDTEDREPERPTEGNHDG